MPALPDPELSRAVLIGASRFQHLPDLPAVRNNLADLRAALTDPAHGIIAPENCLVVEEPKSPHHFMTSLRQTIRTTDDFLLVYYAGHGLRDDTGDKLYLSLNQTDRDELDGSAVPFDFVKRAMENSRARASLLVLDCCYSGMAVGIMSDGVVSQWEIEIRGSAVLASSPKNKTSHSPEGHRHTAFTGRMIHLLENGSPIKNEPLTVNTLYKRVSVALTKEKLPEPKFASTETSGDLLVRRPAEPAAKQVPRPAIPKPSVVRVPPAEPVDRVAPPAVEPLRPSKVPAVPTKPVRRRSGADQRSANRQPLEFSTWIRLIGLRTLWILTGFFLAGGLGGLFSVLTGARRPDGTEGNDVASLWVGFIMALVFGVPLWLKRRRWLSLRREVAPPLVTSSRAVQLIAVSGFAVSLLMLIGAFIGQPSTRVSAASDVTYTVLVGTLGGECAVLCGYMLFAWWRSQRTGAGAGRPKARDSRP